MAAALPEFWAAYLSMASNVVVIALDASGRLVAGNQALTRLIGVEVQRVLGHELSDVLVDESAAAWREVWPPYDTTRIVLNFAYDTQMPQTLICHLVPASRAGGDELWSGELNPKDAQALAHQQLFAPVVAWLIGEVDVPELITVQHAFLRLTNELATLSRERAQQAHALEQARRSLQRRNEELDAFAHIVSHDLKAPLRTFRFFTRILQDRYSTTLDQQGCGYLDLLGTAADRIHQQIEHLLSLAEAGTLLEAHPGVALADIIAELQADLSGLLAEHGAELAIEGVLPEVWGDRQRLRGVFQNLIVNAVVHNDKPDPRVTVAAQQVQLTSVTLAVADNGPGIAEEDLARIWLPFQRSRTAETHNPGGHGLGLAFCRRVVEAHGGQIELVSRPGAGTTFLLTLPRRAPASNH